MNSTEAALAASRLAFSIGVFALFGTEFFQCAIADEAVRSRVATCLGKPSRAAFLITAFGAVVWLPIQAADITQSWKAAADPSTLTKLLSTQIGTAWLIRIALTGALGVALVLQPRQRVAPTIVAAAALTSLVLVGHAASADGWSGTLHQLIDGLHLITAAIWLGGLPAVIVSLSLLGSSLRKEAATTLRRFSTVGHIAVGLVLLTGVANVWLDLGRLPLDLSHPYTALLDLKLVMVMVMVCFALFNRYIFVPKLSGGGQWALTWLVRLTASELLLGCVVLALVSVFGVLDPG